MSNKPKKNTVIIFLYQISRKENTYFLYFTAFQTTILVKSITVGSEFSTVLMVDLFLYQKFTLWIIILLNLY